jgi:hypothetical protein
MARAASMLNGEKNKLPFPPRASRECRSAAKALIASASFLAGPRSSRVGQARAAARVNSAPAAATPERVRNRRRVRVDGCIGSLLGCPADSCAHR